MKKLMIVAAVAMAAVASQAASISWAARNIYIPVATDAKVSQTGIAATSGTKFAADALTVSLYWVSTSGNVAIGDYKTTGTGVIASQTLANGTSAALYTAMAADRGATWKPEYFFTAEYTTKDGTYTYSGSATATVALGDLASKAISTTAKFDTAGTWNYTANVPEPTSGLLLLLGMAGLALKRKIA